MHTALVADDRLDTMAAHCGVVKATIIGACFMVWAMADSRTVDGFLSGTTCAGLDRAVGVPGFCAAMKIVGWMSERPEGVMLDGFVEKNKGTSRLRRESSAARMQQARNIRATTVQQPCNEHATSSSNSSSSESPDSPEGECEGKPPGLAPAPRLPRGHAVDCWDGIRVRAVYAAYPELGRKKPPAALEAIGNAAEWVRDNRPDLGDPLAFLLDRVKAYARSPEGVGRYLPNVDRWMTDRRFMESESSWQRGDGKPKRKSYIETLAENGASHAPQPTADA